MPRTRVEDGICNFYELGKSSWGQSQSQALGGNLLVDNYIQWVGNQGQINTPPTFNLKNQYAPQSAFVSGHSSGRLPVSSFGQNYTESTLSPEFFKSVNKNGFILGHQNFQTWPNQEESSGENAGFDRHNLRSSCFSFLETEQGSASVGSPTLTTTSDKSEITEASVDFSFLSERKQQQHLVRVQPLVTPQYLPMQQSGFNDTQLLRQHIMFKQLQELQRQQQLHQLSDVRQQNSLNQLSVITKQASGSQLPLVVNGTPVRDASQMFMNSMQRGASLTMHGVSSRQAISQEQGQALHSMGIVPQHLDTTLYGTSIASGGNINQFSQLQGVPQDSSKLLTKGNGNETPKEMQLSAFSNSFLGDQFTGSPDQDCMPQGTFVSNKGFPGKSVFGHVSGQGLSSGVTLGNLQQENTLQTYAPEAEFNGRRERANWSRTMQPMTAQPAPAQNVVPLDPLEEKILYNMDGNVWDTSFSRHTDISTGGFGNPLEHADTSGLPSLQSGSWSALMQSAVAETSGSDTGIQEEWSGLTFQNTQLSTDVPPSSLMHSEKNQPVRVENNLLSASSLTSNSNFRGFQQQGVHYSNEKGEGLHQEDYRESVQKSPRNAGEWLHYDPQQNSSIERSQWTQPVMHFENSWSGHNCGISERDAHKQKGDLGEAMYDGRAPNGFPWKIDRSSGIDAYAAVPSSYNAEAHQEAGQQVPDSNQPDYMRPVDVSIHEGNENAGKSQCHISSNNSVFCNSLEGAGEAYQEQQNCYQRDSSNDSCRSKGLRVREQGHFGHFQFIDNNSNNCMNLDKGCLPNIAAQTSQHMLELLHKVDHSREDSMTTRLGHDEYNSLDKVPDAEIPDASITQFYNQTSASQAFGLKLAPPSQQLTDSNHLQVSPRIISPNLRQVISESGDRSQSWLASPSSVQSSPASNEFSHRAHWDNRSSTSGQTGTPSYMGMQGNSVAALTSSPSYIRNQLRTPFMSDAPVECQTAQETLAGSGRRSPPVNLAPSQSNLPQISANHFGQQFPVLEAMSVSQPSAMEGMSQQSGFSERPHNVWKNVPTQWPPSVEHHMVSSMDSTKKGMGITSWASQQGLNHQTARKGGYEYPEFGSGGEPGKERTRQIPSEILDASQTGDLSQDEESVAKHISDAKAFPYGSLVVHSHGQNLDRVQQSENYAATALERNTESFGHSLDQSVKSLSQPTLQEIPSQGIFIVGQKENSNTCTNSNVAASHTEHSQVNMHMAPTWFKQYETFKNAQMVPMYDQRLAKTTPEQFILEKSSQNLQIYSSVAQTDAADASQGGGVWPSTTASLVVNETVSAPQVSPSDATDHSKAIIRPRKRKTLTVEVLPWHKEVTQGSQRLINISMAEEEWAQATNHLIEKEEGEVEFLEDGHRMFQSKRRLILTTQLMQQLLRPAPASILSADATSCYESLTYVVASLSLGDACNLICCTRNDLHVASKNCDMISEKREAFDVIVEGFSDRAKKLENDFSRLDKAASIVDIRVECHDLERFSVINRFAKFHIRGQSYPTGFSSSSTATTAPKLIPQRYVTAFPMPSNIPEEGVQCFSL